MCYRYRQNRFANSTIVSPKLVYKLVGVDINENLDPETLILEFIPLKDEPGI